MYLEINIAMRLCMHMFFSNGEKEGDHEHDHHHGHGHGHDENKRTITPTDVIAMHGINGALDERGLLNACPMLLNCQVQERLY